MISTVTVRILGVRYVYNLKNHKGYFYKHISVRRTIEIIESFSLNNVLLRDSIYTFDIKIPYFTIAS